MSRPKPLSGFPEWLPTEQIAENQVLEALRRTFELHGFTPVHTRAVEPRTQLAGGSDTNKEIYLLRRLGAADAEDDDLDRQLGLHFDLTVPFARYVLENAGRLTFPFRRYQIQKSWRGERPQEGRFREFTQADIDVVGDGDLSFHYDVELPLVIADALRQLPIPPVRMHVNSRKVAEGFYRGLGLTQIPAVLRTVDKLTKIGPEAVVVELVASGATSEQAKACLRLAEIRSEDESFVERVRELGVKDSLLDEGLTELAEVIGQVREDAPDLMVADLSIARGLDYYTGTVYETFMAGHEDVGSVCSGGRYDNLASTGDRRYPGVGLSIGVTRLLSRLFARGLLRASRPVPTAVLIALVDEESRPAANRLAATFRRRGIATEIAPQAAKYGKQIRYADRRNIPYVWFPAHGDEPDQVKDIRSGEQVAVDAATWTPPQEDATPALLTEQP